MVSDRPVRKPVFWMATMMRLWTKLAGTREDERGQGLVEYALIILLVAIVVIGALVALGADIEGMINRVADAFP
jgi:pilus assembly protein Flp/PilA